jgi:signal-transduction protein with cAMP-binding, CBS, and nucleotidyltransferase domain
MADPVINVADLMRTTLHTIDGLASVREAIEEMSRLGVSSLVIERRNPDDEFGIVTVRDIAAKVVAENKSMVRTSVYEVMTKPALTLSFAMNVKYAIRMLSRFRVNRALVTRDNELVGLVTLRDMVVGYAAKAESLG